MATIKSYTDLEQSRKLAEILPLESADMYYHYNEYEERHYPKVFLDYQTADIRQEVLELKRNDPCWSLAALLSVLPVSCDDGQHCLALINSNPNGEIEWLCSYEDNNGNLMMECYADNQVDACIAMIEKLHELKML